jgi:hypothetical protein
MARSSLANSAQRLALACLMLTGSVQASATLAQEPAQPTLRADGTRFALQMADGRTLHSADLVGAKLLMADGQWVRLDAVEQGKDPADKPLWQHRLSVADANGNWRAYCDQHSDGTDYALLVPGRANPDGTVAEDPHAFAISCTAGAQAKCLRFGYRPWEVNAKGNSQRATYNACIHMVRGDYGGQGEPHTEDGKTIDMYDDGGIQTADKLPDHAFEAGWSATGAVCVHHPRVARQITLKKLQDSYPALRGKVGAVCTEAFARANGALLFNRSDPRGLPP